jgi:hypothetical protein
MVDFFKHLKDIEKKSLMELERAYFFFRFKYPKLFLLILCIIAAYYTFSNPFFLAQIDKLKALGYIGIFLAGIFFSFGFTAPFAIGFFINLHPQDILFASLVGALGTLTSNLIFFRIIKTSFVEEFERLRKEHPVKKINRLIRKSIGLKLSSYLLFLIAGIIIASPLPDEIGITMFASLTTIKPRVLGVITYILSTLGIYFILHISAL